MILFRFQVFLQEKQTATPAKTRTAHRRTHTDIKKKRFPGTKISKSIFNVKATKHFKEKFKIYF